MGRTALGLDVAIAVGFLLVVMLGLRPTAWSASGADPSHSAGEAASPAATPDFFPVPTSSMTPAPTDLAIDVVANLQRLPIAEATSDPRLIYGVSPDAQWSAYRESWSGAGPIHLVTADGTEFRVDVGPTDVFAPQAADFSPDSTRLAVVAGDGALWTIDVASRTPHLVSTGTPNGLKFGRSIRFADAERVYVQLVGSVEVPIPSYVAVVDLRDGGITFLSDDPWAYGPRPLADGTFAYVHLKADGSYVVRHAVGEAVVDLAEVGFIHGGVDISTLGAVAFSDGKTTWIVVSPDQQARSLQAATQPRFGPDGQTVVVYDRQANESSLYTLSGTLVATVPSAFATVTMTGDHR